MDFTEKKLNQILNLLNLIHNENTFILGFVKNLFINEADRKAMEEYIEFYNTKRLQAKLKGLTPMDYRNQALIVYLFLLLSI